MEYEILSCPGCGSKEIRLIHDKIDHKYRIVCNCGFYVFCNEENYTIDETIKKWNENIERKPCKIKLIEE